MRSSFITFIVSFFLTFCSFAQNENDKHLQVVLRTVTHEFLIQLEDSTTRILPIEKMENGYLISFENKIAFEPSALSYAAIQTIQKVKLQEQLIFEVVKCNGEEVVHSFEYNPSIAGTLEPCKQRALPLDCYQVKVTVIYVQAEIPPFYLRGYFIAGLVLFFLLVGLFIYFKKNQNTSNKEMLSIGSYVFDRKKMMLTLKKKEIELSSKEADLLYLLYSNENKTLEREHILNVVWGDGGDYIGRTLDVFISKIRKKLEHDSNIEIKNIRGVGYRFIIHR